MDRVVPHVGLGLCLQEVVSAEGGLICPGDGAPHFNVVFRLVTFQPFVGEVLSGRLTRCDPTGLQVSKV